MSNQNKILIIWDSVLFCYVLGGFLCSSFRQAAEHADKLHWLFDNPGWYARQILQESEVVDQARPGEAPHVTVVIGIERKRAIWVIVFNIISLKSPLREQSVGKVPWTTKLLIFKWFSVFTFCWKTYNQISVFSFPIDQYPRLSLVFSVFLRFWLLFSRPFPQWNQTQRGI